MRSLLVVLVTLAFVALGALLFPYTGLFDVAATTNHTGLLRWYLSTTAEHSVKARAVDVTVPADLTDSVRVARGAVGYAQMCFTCHGAPDREPGVIGLGMTPEPPRLSDALTTWSTEEVYWILKHGIKMAGMPAFGPTHNEEELWEVVAFVEQLPDMTPERYEQLTAPARATPTDSTGMPHAHDGHDHVH